MYVKRQQSHTREALKPDGSRPGFLRALPQGARLVESSMREYIRALRKTLRHNALNPDQYLSSEFNEVFRRRAMPLTSLFFFSRIYERGS